MSERSSRKRCTNVQQRVLRAENFGKVDKKDMNQSRSSVSFVRTVIPQRELEVYTVKTETTTRVERIRKKKKPPCKLRMAGEASFGSFRAGPQYQHLETPKQQFKGVAWLTTEIASLFPRTQKAVETALGELLIYALFVIIILIVIVNLNVHEKFHYGQYLRRNLVGRPQNYANGFVSTNEVKSFDEILNQRQMFRYLNDTFIQSEFMDYFYKRAYTKRKIHIRDFNNIIGAIIIRQFRMPNDSCIVPDVFKNVYKMKKCYGEYAESKSNKDLIKPRYDALTATTYAAFNIEPFKYTEPDNEYNIPLHGVRSDYPGSGGFSTQYMSEHTIKKRNLTAEDHNKYLNTILHASGWIRRESRSVIIEVLNYNPSIRMMGQAKIIFEYLPEGGILPSLQLNIIRVYYLQNTKDYFILGLMIAICAFLIIFIVQEIREVAFFGWRYIIRFWSWIDIAIIVSGIAAQVNLFSGMIELKYRTDEYFGSQTFNLFTFRLDNVVKSELAYDESMCWLLFFTCFKIIRYSIYFGYNDRFSRTFSQAGSTLIAFAFRYGTAFIAFAQFGYFLFGTYVESYSTFYLSCLAIVRFYFGYIDYEELIKVRGVLGLIYVLLLLLYMVGYMMAFLLVILFNFYTINESEVVIKRGPTAGGMCCSWCTRLKHYFIGRKKQTLPVDNITTDELLDSLDILNFTDPEIDVFQMKYKLNEKQTSEPEYVSKILWNVIEEIQTDVKKTDEDLHGVELDDSVKNEKRKPLYTKQYNALVKQMKNLEIQAEILFEKTTRSLATARIGKCMFQPRTVIKEDSQDPSMMKM